MDLGWGLSDVVGYKQVGHTGGLAGIVTQVTLIPELKLGIIVLTNQQSGEAFNAITNTIKDSYLGIKGIDRIKQYSESAARNLDAAKKITDDIWKDIELQQKNISNINDSIYTGTYSDKWFGEISISSVKREIMVCFKKISESYRTITAI